ncbi:polysaccharide deacetylase family protein [Chitinophaga sancti]|uniref:polysaccharide deacetylase family protein n=1 Tax=Chitinophaga sancti TaxID=1004 RepID=UPI003F78C2DE
MTENSRYILLSFDVEEFDMPIEYDCSITLQEQLTEGWKGLQAVMEVVNYTNVPATFFTTATFACHYPEAIRKIAKEHEIASHTLSHSNFNNNDLIESRIILERITGKPVYGLRMPRMMHVDMKDVKQAGYKYDSSINPTWIPGRYNNIDKPRTIFTADNMIRIPTSVSPNFRIPLFWLTFKNFPYYYFKQLVLQTLAHDGYVCLYMHPWEFTDINRFDIPNYTKRGSGKWLCERLLRLIKDLSGSAEFVTMHGYLKDRHLPV